MDKSVVGVEKSKVKKLFVFSVLSLILLCVGGYAIGSLSAPQQIGYTTNGIFLNRATDVLVSGDYAYVASFGSDMLTLLNVTNKSAPSYIAFYSNSTSLSGALKIFLLDNYIYIASYVNDSLTIINVTDKSAPQQIGYITNSTSMNGAYSVFTLENYSYVASFWSNSLTIINVTNKGAPQQIGYITNSTSLFGASDVYVVDNFAYITASYDDSLTIINVTDKNNPQQVGYLKYPPIIWYPVSIKVVNNFSYVVSDQGQSLVIVNTTNKVNPNVIGYITNSTSMNGASDVFISGNYSWVVSGASNSLTTINITNKSTPQQIGYISNVTSMAGNKMSIFGLNGYIYVTSETGNSLVIFDTSDTIKPNIQIKYPSNNSNFSTNVISVNYSVSDLNLQSCWYSNDTYVKNTTITCGQNISLTWSDAQHNVTVWANDSSGNENYSTVSFMVDTTLPNVIITYPSNNSNFSTNVISVNYSVSDLNLQSCWYSNDTYVKNTTITCGQNISLTWSDAQHNVTVWANDSVGNVNSSRISFRVDTQGPQITINSPSPQNYGNNQSLNLNYTSLDAGIGTISSCWYKIVNKTGGGIVLDNTTITSCQNTSFNLTSIDNDYNITLYSNDTLNNLNSNTVTFGIRMSTPAVYLITPSPEQWFTSGSNIYFNYTATKDIGIDTCELWGNWSGTWSKNYSWVKPNSGVMNFTILNFVDSYNLWNVHCNDTLNNNGWGLNNQSFGIDSVLPNVSITNINSTLGSQTITFASTETDTNLVSCKYKITNSLGNIDGLNNNVTFTCNTPVSATNTAFGSYNLTVYAKDKANNEQYAWQQYTISPTSPIIIGGGGGGNVPLLNKTWSMVTEYGSNATVVKNSPPGVEISFNLDFLNQGTQNRTIKLSCEGNLCDYLMFSPDTIKLPIERISQNSTVKIKIPLNSNVTETFLTAAMIATDELGNKDTISVKATLSSQGFFSKLFTSKNIGGIAVPYLVIWLINFVVGGFIVWVFIKVTFKKNKSLISFIIGGIAGLIAVIVL